MLNPIRFLLLGTLVTLLGVGAAGAQEAASARIVGITATNGVVTLNSSFNNLESRRLPKFAPVGRQVPQAVLLVDWQTSRALPAGTLVQFSYRQPGSDEVRTIDHFYNQPVTGRQQSRFAVNLLDPARDRVASWRVQLLHRGTVLDEQRSAAWR